MRYAGAVGRRGRVEFSPAMVAGRAGSGAGRAWLRARAGWAWCAVAGLLLLTTLAAAPAHAQTGICGRTAVVQTAILDAITGVTACANVTSSHLAAIDKLDLGSSSINALAAGDFAGLTTLADLDLSSNDLATLPAGVFAGLTAPNLELQNNDLATLPAGVFADLTALELLRLKNNDLATLPAGVFAGLTAVVDLYLENNDLATLPAGVFAGLTALRKSVSEQQRSGHASRRGVRRPDRVDESASGGQSGGELLADGGGPAR